MLRKDVRTYAEVMDNEATWEVYTLKYAEAGMPERRGADSFIFRLINHGCAACRWI